jgi:thiol-disulfide isomerase/thioredoxin
MEVTTMPTTTAPQAPLGALLPDAILDDAAGLEHRLHALLDEGPTLLAFVCNHCPYVQHVERALGLVAEEYRARGFTTIAVVSNDFASYPEDGPDGMREQMARAGWGFAYLRDRQHALALAVGAVCTPDLFVYDADRRLVHRGAFDASTPSNGQPLTGADLRAALDAALSGSAAPDGLAPSLGCSIKWAEGTDPQ